MRRPVQLTLLLVAALALLVGLLLWSTLRSGLSTHSEAPWAERRLARSRDGRRAAEALTSPALKGQP